VPILVKGMDAMSIPDTVTNFLHAQQVPFELLRHVPTRHSMETAHSAHVPGRKLAKGVMLEDGAEYLLAVIPATNRIDWVALGSMLRRPVYMVEESDLSLLLRDCRIGAIPPLGEAYGISTIVDSDLVDEDDLYLEGGDHEHLLHVDHQSFQRLIGRAKTGHFSYSV